MGKLKTGTKINIGKEINTEKVKNTGPVERKVRMAGKMIVTALLFFCVTMPFRRFFGLMGLTEVRPASAFPPIFGLLFGVPGALGCAIGNLVADIVSGYPDKVCLYGFPAQFLYGFLPYLMWNSGKWGRGKHTKNGEAKEQQKKASVRLSSVRQVLKYIGIVFADTIFMAVLLGGILQSLNRVSFFSQFTLLLFYNNLVFCLILGIPMIVLADLAAEENRGRVLNLNVRFVLIFLLLSILSAVLTGISCYQETLPSAKDTVELWNRVYARISLNFFFFWGISVCFLWYLEKNIALPIEELAGIAMDYADREKSEQEGSSLLERCDVLGRFHGEPGYLAKAFKKMIEDVEYYIEDITRITAEKERIHTELRVAASLQKEMLPDSFHTLTDHAEFTVRASMTPAKEVGGDFYDFFLLDEDHLVFLVADISGKGVPAALFMIVSKTLLQSQTKSAATAAQAFTSTNQALCRDNTNGMFVTAWMGVLTISTGKLVYVNAGHTRPLLRREDGSYRYLRERSGFVLAGMEETAYTQQELYIKPGDTIFLYTDGITEANNRENCLYGELRLEQALNRNPALPPEEVITSIWEDVKLFQGDAEQFDDITMLALRYNGNGYRMKSGVPDITNIFAFNGFVDAILSENKFSQKTSNKIRVAVDEIFSNICYYSNAKEITIGCRVLEGEASLYFEDDGIPYNPLEQEEPDITEDMSRRRRGGLGIYIVKKRMDAVRYEYIEGKNRLTIIKKDERQERIR